MSLAEALAAEPDGQKRAICTVRLLLEELEQTDAEALIVALADQKRSSASIARTLATFGHQMRPYTIQRHRRKDCCCGAG